MLEWAPLSGAAHACIDPSGATRPNANKQTRGGRGYAPPFPIHLLQVLRNPTRKSFHGQRLQDHHAPVRQRLRLAGNATCNPAKVARAAPRSMPWAPMQYTPTNSADTVSLLGRPVPQPGCFTASLSDHLSAAPHHTTSIGSLPGSKWAARWYCMHFHQAILLARQSVVSVKNLYPCFCPKASNEENCREFFRAFLDSLLGMHFRFAAQHALGMERPNPSAQMLGSCMVRPLSSPCMSLYQHTSKHF